VGTAGIAGTRNAAWRCAGGFICIIVLAACALPSAGNVQPLGDDAAAAEAAIRHLQGLDHFPPRFALQPIPSQQQPAETQVRLVEAVAARIKAPFHRQPRQPDCVTDADQLMTCTWPDGVPLVGVLVFPPEKGSGDRLVIVSTRTIPATPRPAGSPGSMGAGTTYNVNLRPEGGRWTVVRVDIIASELW
jgi:hypothetical protein